MRCARGIPPEHFSFMVGLFGPSAEIIFILLESILRGREGDYYWGRG